MQGGRILLLTTGGTIASSEGENGLVPTLGANDMVGALRACGGDCTFDVRNLLALDSSNIQPEHWQQIAAAVFEALGSHDGVVITHGTDTMAYTAAALSFMLPGLSQSVVLTGSQVSIEEPLSDAVFNMQTAVAAVRADIVGVTVAFGGKVINGTRAVKTSTMQYDAFTSVNVPPMAEAMADGLRVRTHATGSGGRAVSLERELSPDVFLLKVVPGTKPELFDALAEMGYRGIVLEAFGAGGIHSLGRDLASAVRRTVERGIPVVVCSQCLYERVDMSIYEVGRQLIAAGAISARDMTKEAAVVKLMWALGRTRAPAEIAAIFDTDYAGEVAL